MRSTVPLLILVALTGCAKETKERSLDNTDEIGAIQQAVGALTERIDSAEDTLGQAAMQADLLLTQEDVATLRGDVDANKEAIQSLDANLAMLELVVEQNRVAIAVNGAALGALNTQLHDPDTGEITLLQAQDALVADALAQQRADLDAAALAGQLNGQAVAANSQAIGENAAGISVNTAAAIANGDAVVAQAEAIADLALAGELATVEFEALGAQVATNEESLLAQADTVAVNSDELAKNTATLLEHNDRLNVHSADIGRNADAALVNAEGVLVNSGAIAANSDAIAAAQDGMFTAEQGAALQAGLDAHTVRIDGNQDAIGLIALDYLTSADRTALQGQLDSLSTAIGTVAADYLTSADRTALQGQLDSLSASIGAVASDYLTSADRVAVQTQLDSQGARLEAVSADYLTSADYATLESSIDGVSADVAVIQSNYLPDLDALLPFLSADPDTSTVSVNGADFSVDGHVYGQKLSFRQCDGGGYSCTPQACVDLCQANGERMAFVDEVLAYASEGNDQCRWGWMLDADTPNVPVAAFPMFSNRTAPGCGATNTGNVPRLGGGIRQGTGWDDTQTYDCTCASR